MGANILVQIIGILIYPLLMLNYSVSELSKYGVLYGGMTILSVMITFKIENLFFNIKIKEALFFLNFYFKRVFVSVVILIALIYFFLRIFFERNANVDLFLLISFSAIFLGSFNIVYNFLVRARSLKYNLLKVIRVFLELFCVLVFSFIKIDIATLFFFVSLTYFIVVIYPVVGLLKKKTVSFCVKKRFEFLFYDLLSGLFNNIYLYSPNYFLYYGGAKELSGYYFLINRIFGVPSLMIAQSLSTALKQILVSKNSTRYRIDLDYFNEKIFHKIYLIYFALCCISIFAFYVANFYYPGVFWVFIVLLPMLVLRFKFLSFSGLFYILRAYNFNLKIQFVLFFISFLSAIIGYLINNSWISLIIYSLFTVLVYEYSFRYIYKYEKKVIE
ncbi:hypothetical protein D3C78_278890 [compost metagenome]